MSEVQIGMFDGTELDKEVRAIKLIQMFEEASIQRNQIGYVVGYSGGKDSEVLVDLFIKSGAKFVVIHNHTGLDAPETVYFIRKKFKQWREQGIDCRIYYPKKYFWQLCLEKKMLPTRLKRFCCECLKERNDIPELQYATHSFGVRKTESTNRANKREVIETRNTEEYNNKSFQKFRFDDAADVLTTSACYTNKYFIVNPIADWTKDEVWNYIKKYNIEYNPLYDKGWDRIGCIGCPMAGEHRKEEFAKYPKYENMYRRLAERIEKMSEKPFIAESEKGELIEKPSQGSLFDWWLKG